MKRTTLLALWALALLAPGARGQIVRGVVVDGGSQAPVEGAMVILMTADGTIVHRVLTDADGRFIADADHPGPHVVRIDRIGYESLTTEPFDVPVRGLFKRVEVPIRPVELLGLDVEGARRCEVRPEEGRATARVWEEARKALAAALFTQEARLYRYTLLHYQRELDADARDVLSEKRDFQRGLSGVPYVSAPVEELMGLGFMRPNEDGSFTYFAPDAAAFLSDPFLDTHCMRLEGVEDGSMVLGFEPIEGRRVSDIEGTLRVDARTAKLQALVFRYVNLPPSHRFGNARGKVVFGQLPNGTWIVRDWSITMPRVGYAVRRQEYIRMGYVQEGGVVWRVTDRDGTTIVESATATVAGTLVDSLDVLPLASARVVVVEADAKAVTGEAGTFLLPGLAEGLQYLEIAHPSLDTLGLGPYRATVDAVLGEATAVRVRVPGVRERLEEACGPRPEEGPRTAILFGRVVRGGSPAGAVPLQLRWMASGGQDLEGPDRAAPPRAPGAEGPRWRPSERGARWIETQLDERGIFLLCQVPRGSQARVVVPGDGGEEVTRTVTIPGNAEVVTFVVDISGR